MQYRVTDFFGRVVYDGNDRATAVRAQSETYAHALKWYGENHPTWPSEKRIEYSMCTLDEIPE